MPVVLAASAAAGQTTDDPFPDPIPATDGVITVGAVEFASLPFVDDQAPRMMRLVDEPGTGRLFVSDMWGLPPRRAVRALRSLHRFRGAGS